MKKLKYPIVFILTIIILFFSLVITAKIPRKAIEENIKETTNYFYNKNYTSETKPIKKDKYFTYRHIYADAMLLNIIYFIDDVNPIASLMEAKYYSIDEGKSITYNFDEIIENDYEANVEYMRYWHGSMSIIRPLLVFFNINQIYIFNAIIFAISTLILLMMLLKEKAKDLFFIYLIGFIMCSVWVVPFCLEFFWTFFIMTIISIIAINMNKKNKNLNLLFMISGILTCYFDFLSTELITLFVPLIIILVLNYKSNKVDSFKNVLKFLVSAIFFWSIGYLGMWIAKWILASFILKVNALDYVIDDIKLRIDGTGSKARDLYFLNLVKNMELQAIMKNIKNIIPLDYIIGKDLVLILILIIFVLEIIFIRKKEVKKLWFSGILLLIATVPYIRYAILASHSFTHYFFTFRAQIISIMAILLAIIYSYDLEIVKKEIKIRKKDEN